MRSPTRSRALRTVLVAMTAAAAAVGCALGFSPGDYGANASSDGGLDASEVDAIATLPEAAAVTPRLRHLFVLASDRDGSDPVASDVWSAPLDAQGKVGSFVVLQPGVARAALVTSTIVDGRLFVATRANGRTVEHVGVGDGGFDPDSGWRVATVPGPPVSSFGQVFSRANLVALGGSSVVDAGEGVEPLVVLDRGVRISFFDAGVYSPLTTSATQLPVPLKDMTVATSDRFVYVLVGQGGAAEQAAAVYVALLDDALGVGAFVGTTAVLDPGTTKPHTPVLPMVCAGEGHLFIAGGVGTDVVLSASIDPMTGLLGPWKAGPRLPEPLRGAGCAVWSGALHLIGGQGVTARSDRILRSALTADGAMGSWEPASGENLPAARSGILAFTY